MSSQRERVEPAEAKMEQSESGTTILYAPDGVPHNYYDNGADIVVLDAQMRENETVHSIVREHELKHAENGYDTFSGFVSNLALELKTDLWRHFSVSDEAKEVRQFMSRRAGPAESWRERISAQTIRTLRSLWSIPLIILGAPSRRVREVMADE